MARVLNFSRDFTALPAHPHVYPQSEWAIPAFAFPAITGTHLPTSEGWKAELTLRETAISVDIRNIFSISRAFSAPARWEISIGIL